MRIDIDYIVDCPYLYLEYALNTAFVTGDLSKRLEQIHQMPERIFYSGRYNNENSGKNRICITFTENDLLHISHIALTTVTDQSIYAGGHRLAINTYEQLDNEFYRQDLDRLLGIANAIPSFYNEIKGVDWPSIKTIQDFYLLPKEIVDECKESFGFAPIPVSKENPDIDKTLLRNYFTSYYVDTSQHPFYKQMSLVEYSSDTEVYKFPFSDFFNADKFMLRLDEIGEKFGLDYIDDPKIPRNLKDIRHLHEDFVRRHKFKDIKDVADQVLQHIHNKNSIPLKLTIFQEAYINAKLGGVMNNLTNIWNTSQILDCIT